VVAEEFRERRDHERIDRLKEQVAASLYARSLLEASLDPLVTISPEGKITDLNEATEQVTGLAREALIGTDFSDYFTEPARARTAYVQVFKGGQVRDYPLAIRHTAGSTTDVLYNASLYRDERGKVVGVFAAARDVTHLKRAQRELQTRETALRESEERLALALEATNDGMWDFNVATGDAVFSPRYYNLAGVSPL
jgi:PAS domain S-box-containing protein